jgi:hypothetical protein
MGFRHRASGDCSGESPRDFRAIYDAVVNFPRALLLDFGGTLVIEKPSDHRAGHEWLFDRASSRPTGVTRDDVIDRASRITRAVVERREEDARRSAVDGGLPPGL